MSGQTDTLGIYSTFVFKHKTERDALRVFQAIRRRWPMLSDRRTVNTAWSEGDAMSVADAGRMALECEVLDSFERRELALDVLNLNNWQACLAKFSEWELAIENGELVEVSTDDDETALAADLST
jgi:hypothetical protein